MTSLDIQLLYAERKRQSERSNWAQYLSSLAGGVFSSHQARSFGMEVNECRIWLTKNVIAYLQRVAYLIEHKFRNA